MSATVADALAFLRPGAQWVSVGNTYAGIDWLDQTQTQPMEQEVTDAMATLDAQAATETGRQLSLSADASQQDLLNRLKTATPAQIDTWLTNNVTNLAQARTVLGAIVKFLATRIQ